MGYLVIYLHCFMRPLHTPHAYSCPGVKRSGGKSAGCPTTDAATFDIFVTMAMRTFEKLQRLATERALDRLECLRGGSRAAPLVCTQTPASRSQVGAEAHLSSVCTSSHLPGNSLDRIAVASPFSLHAACTSTSQSLLNK